MLSDLSSVVPLWYTVGKGVKTPSPVAKSDFSGKPLTSSGKVCYLLYHILYIYILYGDIYIYIYGEFTLVSNLQLPCRLDPCVLYYILLYTILYYNYIYTGPLCLVLVASSLQLPPPSNTMKCAPATALGPMGHVSVDVTNVSVSVDVTVRAVSACSSAQVLVRC